MIPLLVADVGATNTRLGVVKDGEFIFVVSISSRKVADFSDFIDNFIKEAEAKFHIQLSSAVIAAAGPSDRERIELQNAMIVVDSKEILRKTTLKEIFLINDSQAMAYFVKNKLKKDGVLVLSVGTGLGVSFLYGGKVFATEQGHLNVDFANKSLKKIFQDSNVVEYEHLLSGRGVENIYCALSAATGKSKKKTESVKKMPVEQIFKQKDSLSKKALILFAWCVADFIIQVSNQNNEYFGIVVLTGGVIRRNEQFFSSNEFKTNVKNYLKAQKSGCPAIVILPDEYLGLRGALAFYEIKKADEIKEQT